MLCVGYILTTIVFISLYWRAMKTSLQHPIFLPHISMCKLLFFEHPWRTFLSSWRVYKVFKVYKVYMEFSNFIYYVNLMTRLRRFLILSIWFVCDIRNNEHELFLGRLFTITWYMQTEIFSNNFIISQSILYKCQHFTPSIQSCKFGNGSLTLIIGFW